MEVSIAKRLTKMLRNTPHQISGFQITTDLDIYMKQTVPVSGEDFTKCPLELDGFIKQAVSDFREMFRETIQFLGGGWLF